MSCFAAAVKSIDLLVVLNLVLVTFCLLRGDVKGLYRWDTECTQIHKDVRQMEEVGKI